MNKNIDILVVEDSKTQAENLKFILENDNYTVWHVLNGEEALEALKDFTPKIIISDIIMPLMDGFTLCSNVKSNYRLKGIPFILLTSLSDTEDIIKGLVSGADSFITKPFNEEFLLSKIQYHMLNFEFRQNQSSEMGLEILFGGRKHLITSDRLQILDLLISTYESAVIKNRELQNSNTELQQSKNELAQFNKNLEKIVEQRTLELQLANENLSKEIDVRKSAEKRILKLNRIYAVLSNINQAIVRIHETNQLLKDACMIAVDDGKFQSAWIGIVNNETKEIEISASAGLTNDLIEVCHDENPITGVIRSGKHFISNNIYEDNSITEIWKQNSLSLGFISFAIFPLIVLGKTIGSFCIYSDEVGLFDEIEISLLDEMAKDISFALEYIQKEFERKRGEEELRVALTKYKTLFDCFPLGITVSDEAGNILETNSSAEKLLGIPQTDQNQRDIDSPEWHIVRPDGTPMPPDEYASVRALKHQCKVENVEMGIVKPDNMITWINVIATPLSLEGYGVVITYNDITERILTEKSLRESESRFRALFETSADGILIANLETKIFNYANPSMCRMLGYTENELITLSVANIHPKEALQSVIVEFEAQARGEKVLAESLPCLKKDGTIFYADVNTVKITIDGKAYNAGFFRDITERKRAEEALMNERKMLRTLIDNIPDGIYVKDIYGRKLISNPADLKVIGVKNESEVLGKTDLELFHGKIGMRGHNDDMQIIKNGIALINKNENFVNEEGRLLWLLTTKVPLFDEFGNTTGLVGIGRDITEQKQVEKELKTALEKAQEADRLKTTFLATMSHELRTPLNAVIGFSSLIEKDTDLKDILDFSEMINTSGNQLLDIVENILDFSLIETGIVQVKNCEFPIDKMLVDAYKKVLTQKEKINKNGIEIIYNPRTEDKNLLLNTDISRIQQILTQLLNNALKFTKKGTIEFGFSKIEKEGIPLVKFFVKDTGIGIPKDKQEIIFKMFRQADESNTREYGGTGLGLAIAKKLVEILRGEIWVESEEDKGSTFYFTIPIDSL